MHHTKYPRCGKPTWECMIEAKRIASIDPDDSYGEIKEYPPRKHTGETDYPSTQCAGLGGHAAVDKTLEFDRSTVEIRRSNIVISMKY